MSGNPVMISGLTALDRLAAQIESRSRDLIGHNRQASRALVDVEILRGYADRDEMENEDRVCRHGTEFLEIEDLASSSPEFHEPGCVCVNGRQCQICCTHRDLMTLMEIPALSRGRNVEVVPVLGHKDEFYLIIPLSLARLLQFI